MTLRPFAIEDLDQVLELFYQTVHTVNARDYVPAQLDAWAPGAPDRQDWLERLSTNTTLIVEQDGHILGFGSLSPDGAIDVLYTHKDHQRAGLGSALLARLIGEALRAGHTMVRTEASITARPFFEANGFVVKRPNQREVRGTFFQNYVMTRDLRRPPEEETTEERRTP